MQQKQLIKPLLENGKYIIKATQFVEGNEYFIEIPANEIYSKFILSQPLIINITNEVQEQSLIYGKEITIQGALGFGTILIADHITVGKTNNLHDKYLPIIAEKSRLAALKSLTIYGDVGPHVAINNNLPSQFGRLEQDKFKDSKIGLNGNLAEDSIIKGGKIEIKGNVIASFVDAATSLFVWREYVPTITVQREDGQTKYYEGHLYINKKEVFIKEVRPSRTSSHDEIAPSEAKKQKTTESEGDNKFQNTSGI